MAKEMVFNNIRHNCDYNLELIGITAHVYADTFAHYGFSGVSSRRNRVNGSSLILHQSSITAKIVMGETVAKWFKKYGKQGGLLKNIRAVISGAAELATGALGHGGVSIYPDQPYLKWSFEYEYVSDSIGKISKRNNQSTFLEASKYLYNMFFDFSRLHPEYSDLDNRVDYEQIKPIIKEILKTEGDKFIRAKIWCKKMADGEILNKKEKIPMYNSNDWHKQYDDFSNLTNPKEFAKLNIYKFSQSI